MTGTTTARRRAGPDELVLAGTLRLVQEARVRDLLPAGAGDRLEASGVLAADGRLYVIFDNVSSIAVLDQDLGRIGGNLLVERTGDAVVGAEDIARDPVSGHYYVLVEALPRGDGFQAWVEELDERFEHVAGQWLDFPLPCINKGLEGLTCLRRDGVTYLLGLCEGNRCRGGAAGRRPGDGRLQVFRRDGPRWVHVGRIRLPGTAWFEDYSSVSVHGDRIAVVSQQSSALWVGHLPGSGWVLEDPGTVYAFPRDDDGRPLYCTVEGVSWLDRRRVTVVSDRAKAGQGGRCRRKEQSVHIFELPASTSAGRGPA